jgi:hypothetical protein
MLPPPMKANLTFLSMSLLVVFDVPGVPKIIGPSKR